MKKCKADLESLHGYRIKLYPTEKQKERLNELINLYRYVYNWTIGKIEEHYAETKELLNINKMCTIFKNLRNSTDWLLNIPLNTGREAIRSAYAAFSKFFKVKWCKKPKQKFLSKKDKKGYFKVRGERIYFRDGMVGFEGLGRRENIICKNHNVPANRRLYNCAITYDGYEYFLTFSMEIYYPIIYNTYDPIGVDVGLRNLVTLSDGTVYKLPNTYKEEKRIKRLQRQVNKDRNRLIKKARQAKTKLEDIPLSKNMLKHKSQLHYAYKRERNIRNSYIHKMTSEIIAKNPSAIVVETLNVQGMLKNKFLAKYIKKAKFADIIHQLEYKSKRNPDIRFIKADRWYPSSQICSSCGYRQNIGETKIYRCPVCGLTIDRDLNAAINLRNIA